MESERRENGVNCANDCFKALTVEPVLNYVLGYIIITLYEVSTETRSPTTGLGVRGLWEREITVHACPGREPCVSAMTQDTNKDADL